jgi:hypothetical protein
VPQHSVRSGWSLPRSKAGALANQTHMLFRAQTNASILGRSDPQAAYVIYKWKLYFHSIMKGENYILAIAIDKYSSKEFPSQHNAKNDAKRFLCPRFLHQREIETNLLVKNTSKGESTIITNPVYLY